MTTAATTARALAGWDCAGDGPLPERLAEGVQRALLDGRVAIDARLPSERELAAALGVSRETVSVAYAALRGGGWLSTRRGAGSTATLPRMVREGMAPSDSTGAVGAIDMRSAAPAAPVTAFRSAVSEALAAITPQLTAAEPIRGLDELRARIAERHRSRGAPTTPEQILITGGALPALWLVLAAALPRSPRVVVETPTYPRALEALRERRARLVGLPVADGWQPAQFDLLLRQHEAVAAYLVPDFHNPTGRLMDGAVRSELAELAERRSVLLIVDETMVEIDLRGGSRRPPAALRGPHVVTLGSLSKALWDGLQVGWIRAEPELIERLTAHPLAAQLASPPLEQAIASALLADLDRLLKPRRRTLRTRRDHLLAGLERLDGIDVPEPPAGGLSTWARLERGSSARIAVAAAERGLMIDPGGRFAPLGGLDRNLRLPYALPTAQLDLALERLEPLLR